MSAGASADMLTSPRLIGAAATLVVVWIVVYWAWEPRPAAITFDPLIAPPPGSQTTAASSPLGAATPATEPPSWPPSPGSPDAAPMNTSAAAAAPPSVPDRRAEAKPPAPPAGAVAAGPTLSAAGQSAAGAAPRLVPPEFREYTVRSGDRLDSIAERELGASELWVAIAKSNPTIDPNRLRVGQVIRIPIDPANVQGIVVGGDAAGVTDAHAPDAPGAIEYRVASGDTLSGIASRFYGSQRFAELIFTANRDRLRTPDDLRVGQTLVIPPAPAGAVRP